jgi:hypothetical protein
VVLKRTLPGLALALSLSACSSKPSGLATLDLGTQAQIGLEFATQRGCATCHQSSRDSDGILSGQTTPAPMTAHVFPGNLSNDIMSGLGGWADIEIVRAMRYGVDNASQPLCPPMPHFDGSDPKQPAMTDVEANAIVAYLRALPPVARAIPPSLCPPLKPPAIDMATAHD